jgi:signal transduction histidine kinase/ligand-binding sensor domain-containing protein
MRHKNILSILIILLLDGYYLTAQQLPFVHYSPKDGLVSNRVRLAYQDSKGRMYFTTYGGLSVYDGSRFTNYTTDNGLVSNMINQVIEMGDDSLWVIPNYSRIQCLVYGKIKDLITADAFYPVINELIKCSDGFYYALADGGLYRYERNRFVRMTLKDREGKEINNYFVHGEEVNKKLFLVTDISQTFFPSPSYLVVFDMMTGEAIISKKPPEIYFLAKTPQNEILIATSAGLKTLDNQRLLEGQIHFLPPPPVYKAAEKLKAGFLYFDHEENLWVLSEKGMSKVNKQGQSKFYTIETGLTVNYYNSVFQDKEHIIWCMNQQTGVSKLANHGYEMQTFIKSAFMISDIYAHEKSDSVWFMDPAHKKIFLQHPQGSREFDVNFPADAYKIIVSGYTVYIGGGPGPVYTFDASSKTNRVILRFLDSAFIPGSPGSGSGFMMPDNNGNFVFVNWNITAVIRGKRFHYPLGYMADQFSITADNHLWVATRNKDLFLFKLNPQDTANYFQLIKQYKEELPAMGPRSLTVDKNGILWIGSRDNGLFCFYFDKNFKLTSWRQFTTRNGLSDNHISYLHADPEGNIWACSPVGLDKVQITDTSVVIENITRANDIYQHVAKIYTSKTGVKWILSSAGIIKIEPTATPSKSYQAKIFFTNIEVPNKNLTAASADLTLSYKQNDISFYVAAPSFIDEKQTLFSYRLKGSANEEWSEPSPNSEIRFINLAPGNYTLYVKAIFRNGAYPDTETSYPFEIKPPWWGTFWFRILLSILIAAITAVLVRNYFRGKLNRQKNLLEKQQAIEKERSRIASDMHDDLGAGLSTIKFLSEKVKRNSFSDVTREDADNIVLNSNDLVQKMNEIIWAMNEKNDTLEDLLFYTRSYAMEYCEENNLACEVRLPELIPPLEVSGEIRRNVFLIIKESLHNIVKHAEASLVTIQFRYGDDLFFSVSDNGKGLNNNKQLSGNGLLNMKKRIQLLGGVLDFKNGNGLTVEFKVPLRTSS